MPQIKPTSVEDLLKFIEDHRSDIENGTYDICIEDDWVPQIQQDTMFFLVKHCPSCRFRLSKNINTPKGVLEILARDPEADIRCQVAYNPNASLEILTRLAKDSDPSIRGWVARHPNASDNILSYLANDNSYTQMTVRGISKAEYFPRASEYVSVSDIVANNHRTPNNILAILAKSNNPVTRWFVAQNPNTPTDVLAILSRDPHDFSDSGYSPRLLIQEAVAQNLKTSPDDLKVLSASDSEEIRKAADPSAYIRDVKKKKHQKALKASLIFFGIIGGICGLIFGCAAGISSGNFVGGLIGGLLVGLLIGAAVGYLWSFLALLGL